MRLTDRARTFIAWVGWIAGGVAIGVVASWAWQYLDHVFVGAAMFAGLVAAAWVGRIAWLDEKAKRLESRASLKFLEDTRRLARDKGGIR